MSLASLIGGGAVDSAGPDAKLQQALAADAVDIGLGSGPELAFVAKGNSELGVAAFAGPPNGIVLVVRSDVVADLVRDAQTPVPLRAAE